MLNAMFVYGVLEWRDALRSVRLGGDVSWNWSE